MRPSKKEMTGVFMQYGRLQSCFGYSNGTLHVNANGREFYVGLIDIISISTLLLAIISRC